MNILLIGGGGREHCIALSLSKSSEINELHCIPGNAGIEKIAKCHSCDVSNQQEVLKFCQNNKIDIVFIGPEIPLVEGLADCLNRNGFFTFGPNQKAAQLEGSKSFTKDILTMESNISSGIWSIQKKTDSSKEFKIPLQGVYDDNLPNTEIKESWIKHRKITDENSGL